MDVDTMGIVPGITPACAGSTGCPLESRTGNRDHPRLRGEYYNIVELLPYQIGSPPLARGVLLLVLVSAVFPRITPACAGSTR